MCLESSSAVMCWSFLARQKAPADRTGASSENGNRQSTSENGKSRQKPHSAHALSTLHRSHTPGPSSLTPHPSLFPLHPRVSLLGERSSRRSIGGLPRRSNDWVGDPAGGDPAAADLENSDPSSRSLTPKSARARCSSARRLPQGVHLTTARPSMQTAGTLVEMSLGRLAEDFDGHRSKQSSCDMVSYAI